MEFWRQLNKYYWLSAFGTAVLTFLFIYIILYFLSMGISPSPTNLESIELKEGMIPNAQKEMEILSNFLMSNGQQIMLIRQIMVGFLAAIAAYILKEELKEGGNRFSRNRYKIFLIMFFIFLSAFVIELVIQITQTALTNRIYQLDNSINKEIIRPCSNQLQDVFSPKERFYYDPPSLLGLSVKLITAPTFILFYIPTFIFIYIFLGILKENNSNPW